MQANIVKTMATAGLMTMFGALVPAGALGADVTPAEARAIAKEAFVYGFPIVDNYRIQYPYFEDSLMRGR